MKKTILTIMSSLSLSCLTAQNSIPNGGFENWASFTSENPDFFHTSNMEGNGTGLVSLTKSNNSYSGSFSVKLTTMSNGTDTIFGFIANGDPGQPVGSGIPISGHPTSFNGYYKSNIALGDSAVIIVSTVKGGAVSSFNILTIGGAQSSYVPFSVPISLQAGVDPDSVVIAVASSNPFGPSFLVTPGSYIEVDSIYFAGIANQPVSLNGDFEQWTTTTQDLLNAWSNVNNQGVSKTSSATEGLFALMLTTSSENGMSRNTSINSGISVQNGTVGGHPYTLQSDSLIFDYDYQGSADDSAKISLMFKMSNNTTEYINLQLPSTSGYVEVREPINLSVTPDSVIVFINSSKFNGNHVNPAYIGSELMIDHLRFQSQEIISAIKQNSSFISTFPNPSIDRTWITHNERITSLDVTNIQGNILQSWSGLSTYNFMINTENYANGTYIIKVNTEKGNYNKKLIVQH